MRIVVLGASGQIGSVIYNGLMGHCDLTGTSRKGSDRFMKFDPFTDDWSHLGIMDVLINCVGQIEATRLFSFKKIHEGLTKLIVKNRSLIGNPRIIQISALGASRYHHVPFLRTKGIADYLLTQHNDTFILRPSIVCTPNTMIVKKMLMLRRIAQYTCGIVPIPTGFLTTRIQPVMPNDLVQVVKYYCHNAGPQVLNVTGSEVFSFGQILSIMIEKSKLKIRPVNTPRFVSGIVARLGFSRLISQQQYKLLFEDNVADTATLRRMLKREPETSRSFFINEFSHASY